MAQHTRSTIRTLITKAAEGMRIAKQNMDAIEMIRNSQKKGTLPWQVADQCLHVAKTTFEQQKAVFDKLSNERQEVGTYTRKKKARNGPSKKALGIAQEYRRLLDKNPRQRVIQYISNGRKITLQEAERHLDEYLDLLPNHHGQPANGKPESPVEACNAVEE